MPPKAQVGGHKMTCAPQIFRLETLNCPFLPKNASKMPLFPKNVKIFKKRSLWRRNINYNHTNRYNIRKSSNLTIYGKIFTRSRVMDRFLKIKSGLLTEMPSNGVFDHLRAFLCKTF